MFGPRLHLLQMISVKAFHIQEDMRRYDAPFPVEQPLNLSVRQPGLAGHGRKGLFQARPCAAGLNDFMQLHLNLLCDGFRRHV